MTNLAAVSCSELLSAALGRPLQRPCLEEFLEAWVTPDRGHADITTMSSEYLGPAWDCFHVADWLVEAQVSEVAGQWALSLRAVPCDRWDEAARVLRASRAGSSDHAWSELPPTLLHPLFDADVALRHRGGPWVRRTTRLIHAAPEAEWRAEAHRWSIEFVDDLPRSDRWLEGEHLNSAAPLSRGIFRLKDWQLGMDIIVVPREGGETPAFSEVMDRVVSVRSVGRRGPFKKLAKRLPSAWTLAKADGGGALLISAGALDQLTDTDVAATVDVLREADSDFWTYEIAARRLFTADDLQDFWLRARRSTSSGRGTASGITQDLQLVVVPRDRDWSFDDLIGCLEDSVSPRTDGRFGPLLPFVTGVWDVEEAEVGDVLLAEIPKGRALSGGDVDAIGVLIDRAERDFFIIETRTMDCFTREHLRQWWQEQDEQ